MISDNLAERIQAGVGWLHVNEPNWARRVNPSALRMVDGDSCLLAQLEHEWRRTQGIEDFSDDGFTKYLSRKNLSRAFSVEHGFALAFGEFEFPVDWDDAWVEQIHLARNSPTVNWFPNVQEQ